MGKGRIDLVPEMAEPAEVWLPRGVTVTKREAYGSATRMEIEGPQIEDGEYQIVVIDEPMRRVIELQRSPHQQAADQAKISDLAAQVAKFDHDGDGRIGGSKKGRRAKKAAKKGA